MSIRINIEHRLLNMLWKLTSGLVLIAGFTLLFADLAGKNRSFQILNSFNVTRYLTNQSAKLAFIDITSNSDLKRELANARNLSKPAMIIFSASWCNECINLEKNIFINKNINQLMRNFVVLQVDVSDYMSNQASLMKNYHIVAPPAIVFFNSAGDQTDIHLPDDINVNTFSDTLKSVLRAQKI